MLENLIGWVLVAALLAPMCVVLAIITVECIQQSWTLRWLMRIPLFPFAAVLVLIRVSTALTNRWIAAWRPATTLEKQAVLAALHGEATPKSLGEIAAKLTGAFPKPDRSPTATWTARRLKRVLAKLQRAGLVAATTKSRPGDEIKWTVTDAGRRENELRRQM